MLLLIGILCYLIYAATVLLNFNLYVITGLWDVAEEQGIIILSMVLTIAYYILFSGPLAYGVAFAFLKASRNEQLKVKDMFKVFNNYWNVVLSYILVYIIVIVGFALLIIPGIFLGCKLVFVPFLVVDKKMGVIEAIKESWRMTNRHAWKVFFIGLLAIPICIAGYICFFIGVFISVMWICTSFATLYHAIDSAGQAYAQVEVPAL
jgi:uncharacterized membrane protein